MYHDDLWKAIGALLFLNVFLFIAMPLLLADYDIVISPKPVEVLEQQGLLAQISSLEKDNADLREVIEAYPPEPVNYSSAITFLGFYAVLICVVFLIYQTNLKEKELKILQETKGGKKK